jgi:hypothetical protein
MNLGTYLHAVAHRIEGRWRQNVMLDYNGGVCLVGGLLQTTNDEDYINEAIELIAELIGIAERFDIANKITEIELWNDRPERTEREVINLVLKAADTWETRQPVKELLKAESEKFVIA